MPGGEILRSTVASRCTIRWNEAESLKVQFVDKSWQGKSKSSAFTKEKKNQEAEENEHEENEHEKDKHEKENKQEKYPDKDTQATSQEKTKL